MTAEPVIQVATANRLSDGVPIYFTREGAWSPRIADAVTDTDGETLLAAAGKSAPVATIGPYVIEVALTDGAIRPIGLREEIRAFGPTA